MFCSLRSNGIIGLVDWVISPLVRNRRAPAGLVQGMIREVRLGYFRIDRSKLKLEVLQECITIFSGTKLVHL